MKENCHKAGTSDDFEMKFRPVLELDKRNKTPSKDMTLTSCLKIMTSLSFFQFMSNLEESGSQIPDA